MKGIFDAFRNVGNTLQDALQKEAAGNFEEVMKT